MKPRHLDEAPQEQLMRLTLARTLYDKAGNFFERGSLDVARQLLLEVHTLAPGLTESLNYLAVIASRQNNTSRAFRYYLKMHRQNPDHLQTNASLAKIYMENEHQQQAEQHLRRYVSSNPEHVYMQFNLACNLLAQGKLKEGFERYETRIFVPDYQNPTKHFQNEDKPLGEWNDSDISRKLLPGSESVPRWKGEDLQGKSILILMEQGYGDTFQFIRYVPLLVERGADIHIFCRDENIRSVLKTVPGARHLYILHEIIPYTDYQCLVMSLPAIFVTELSSIPSTTGYIRTDFERCNQWKNRLDGYDGLKVGITWSGTEKYSLNSRRSITFAQLEPLLGASGISWFSLQKESHGVSHPLLNDLTAHISDFADTAAFISCLDLVISVDTSIAHLAGALGKPVWTLLYFPAEWRWLCNRDDSPWYPTMRLFRQTARGGWNQLIQDVQRALETLVTSLNQLFGTAGPSISLQEIREAGLRHFETGDTEKSREYFNLVLTLTPGDYEIHATLGNLEDILGNFTKAVVCYDKALAIHQGNPVIHLNRANTLKRAGRVDEAIQGYYRVLEIDPRFLRARLILANMAFEAGDYVAAEQQYNQVLLQDPRNADALLGSANLMHKKKNLDEALRLARLALAVEVDPEEYYFTWKMLGVVLHDYGRYQEARECFLRGLSISPISTDLLNNMGVVSRSLGCLPEISLTYYRRALQLDPENQDAHWNRALILLSQGRYEEGWQEYEWRFKKTPPIPQRHSEIPRWDGKACAGKTILLHAEQGYGDMIQFIRYAPILASSGARVIVECQDASMTELIASVEGVSNVVIRGEAIPAADYQIPLMSLPFAMHTTIETIPLSAGYIKPDGKKMVAWKERVKKDDACRIGIVWKGRSTFSADRHRSMSFSEIRPLLNLPGVVWFSLQIGGGEDIPEQSNIIDLTNDIHSFADTAAFISCLDLVITVDTAIAHLAGALGIPVYILLYIPFEWRWMLNGNSTPWYASMHLFRQSISGDWSTVISTVKGYLEKMLKFRSTVAISKLKR